MLHDKGFTLTSNEVPSISRTLVSTFEVMVYLLKSNASDSSSSSHSHLSHSQGLLPPRRGDRSVGLRWELPREVLAGLFQPVGSGLV